MFWLGWTLVSPEKVLQKIQSIKDKYELSLSTVSSITGFFRINRNGVLQISQAIVVNRTIDSLIISMTARKIYLAATVQSLYFVKITSWNGFKIVIACRIALALLGGVLVLVDVPVASRQSVPGVVQGPH